MTISHGNDTVDSGPFSPLSRAGLVDRVADTLMSTILAGQIAPGERLAESMIAKQMDLSRAPVREALRLLENSGLVEYRANRGFFVQVVSAQAVSDLYELRIALESAAIRRLVATRAQDALPVLRAQLAEMYRLADADTDTMAQVEADMQFHRLICEGSGNRRYLQLFDQIANETRLGVQVIGRFYENVRQTAESHEPIVAAIAAADPDRAAAVIDAHIREAMDTVTGHFLRQERDRQP